MPGALAADRVPAAAAPDRTAPDAGLGRQVLVYRLLAELLGRIPDARTVRALRRPEVAGAFAEAGHDLGLELLPDDPARAAVDLAVEYGRLFCAPGGHVPPYESVHAGGAARRALWRRSTSDVRRRMAAWGLSPKVPGRVPDHIAVELDFLAHLCDAEARLCARGEDAAARRCREARRALLDDHLLTWVPAFAERVAERARLPLYREIVRFTAGLLRREREAL